LLSQDEVYVVVIIIVTWVESTDYNVFISVCLFVCLSVCPSRTFLRHLSPYCLHIITSGHMCDLVGHYCFIGAYRSHDLIKHDFSKLFKIFSAAFLKSDSRNDTLVPSQILINFKFWFPWLHMFHLMLANIKFMVNIHNSVNCVLVFGTLFYSVISEQWNCKSREISSQFLPKCG
jgi:hypothetical protein